MPQAVGGCSVELTYDEPQAIFSAFPLLIHSFIHSSSFKLIWSYLHARYNQIPDRIHFGFTSYDFHEGMHSLIELDNLWSLVRLRHYLYVCRGSNRI